MSYQGRHTKAYYEHIFNRMKKFDKQANKEEFLKFFRQLRVEIIKDPGILHRQKVKQDFLKSLLDYINNIYDWLVASAKFVEVVQQYIRNEAGFSNVDIKNIKAGVEIKGYKNDCLV